MKTKVIITSVIISFAYFNFGNSLPTRSVDDSDLSSGLTILKDVSMALEPDRVEELGRRKDLRVGLEFVYERNSEWIPIQGLQVQNELTDENGQILLPCKTKKLGTAELSTDYFKIGDRGQTYRIQWEVACGANYQLQFAESTEAGQAVSVFETFYRGQNRLKNSVGLDFWDRQLKVIWPSNGDYYSWGTVHITNGHHWDVVAHEMGHAIYDFGDLGQFGGGPHKIDECYSKRLALSEGWASFYAAWLYVDLSDPDAKFQHLVPRRAPIRFENVPEDVCRATTNEWRVTAFFWDVVDTNRDLEEVNEMFSLTWAAMYKSNASSIESVRDRLESKGIEKNRLDRAWTNNF